MAKKTVRVGRPPDPDDDWNEEPEDWQGVAELAQALCDKIDDALRGGLVPLKGESFFESIRDGAASIEETVTEAQSATKGKREALENMSEGIDKWLKPRK